LHSRTRHAPWAYSSDPNRAFISEKDPHNNHLQQFVVSVVKILRIISPTHLVDFHTHTIASLPHTRVVTRDISSYNKSVELANAIGLSVVECPEAGSELYVYAARALECASVLLEIGPSDCVDFGSKVLGVTVVYSVLKYAGSLCKDFTHMHNTQVSRLTTVVDTGKNIYIAKNSFSPKMAGVFDPVIGPGDFFFSWYNCC